MHARIMMSRVLYIMVKRARGGRRKDKQHADRDDPGDRFQLFRDHVPMVPACLKMCQLPRGWSSQSKASFARPRTPASQSSWASSRNRFSA
jgi:hypothetical protein